MTDGPITPPPGGLPGTPVSIVDRVKNILLTPKTEWSRIDSEPATIAGLYTSYVMILAAIGPLAALVGQQLLGVGFGAFTWKPTLAYSIGSAVFSYALSLAVVYVVALIVDALAPTFGGTRDMVKAFKVAAYASTPGWVAGIFGLVPMLGWLALIGALYGIYLLYLGLPTLMRVGEDKAIGYTAVIVVVNIILYLVVGFIVGLLVLSLFGAAMMGATMG